LISVNRQLQLELKSASKRQDITSSFAGILDIADDAIISVDATQRYPFQPGSGKDFWLYSSRDLGQPLDLLLPLRFHCVHRQYVVDFTKSSEKPGDRRDFLPAAKMVQSSLLKLQFQSLSWEKKRYLPLFCAILLSKQAEETLEQLSRKTN